MQSANCDRFVFLPGPDQDAVGYCQLRRSVAGLSLWAVVKSFNDPADDVLEAPGSCVWAYADVNARDDSGQGEDDDARTSQNLSEPVENLQDQVQSFMTMDETVQLNQLIAAEKRSGQHVQRKCHVEAALLKDTFAPEDVFLKDVCSLQVSFTTACVRACVHAGIRALRVYPY